MPSSPTSSAPEAPPFDEPWQAQAFAMAVSLNQRGLFSWSEWTKALGAEIAAGETIRTKMMNPTTHTRLPRYARGKSGIVEVVRGCFVFPDSNAHGAGEDPRWLYTVRFTARELWGADADPSLEVSIDAFEPYLERA